MNYQEYKDRLNKVITQAKDLPTLPSTATSALQLMGNPRTSMKDLGNVIGSDQAITSKLLRMVNSAYYGFPRKISTISQALVVIGVEGLRSLIMGLSVQSLFNTEIGKELWAHSILTAAGAKIVTQKYSNIHPEEAFVIGLIHDIGRLVVSQHFPEEFEYFNLLKLDNPEGLEKERELFDMDHSEIGAKISTKWNMPTKIVEAIKYHHKPNLAPQNPAILNVCIAEGIANYLSALDDPMNFGQTIELSHYVRKSHLEKLKVQELPEQLLEDIKNKGKELKEIFDSK